MVVRPFFPWVGSKTLMLSQISRWVPQFFNDYWEPFFGGGAVFFFLASTGAIRRAAYLSDINKHLINIYIGVCEDVDKVLAKLKLHEQKHTREYFLSIRAKAFGDNKQLSRPATAAQMIYLFCGCYKGVFKLQKNGNYHMSFGRDYVNLKYGQIRAGSKLLKKATIKTGNYASIRPRRNDLVFIDPPYITRDKRCMYGRFVQDDQVKLRDRCAEWIAGGSTVMMTQGDSEFIRNLYQDRQIFQVIVPVSICDNFRSTTVPREVRPELIIIGTGDPALAAEYRRRGEKIRSSTQIELF